VYRFLLTPRWLGLAALTVVVTAVMALAGQWQLERYHKRGAANDRIDAARTAAPTPVADALPAPSGAAGTAGRAAPSAVEWSRVTVTGRYDRGRQVLARGRTVSGEVGFEVLTPLVPAGGSGDVAVLVDRGWIAAVPGDAAARPALPEPPTGEVTVTARVARQESGASRLTNADGRIEVRRISMPELAAELPYRLYGSYLLLDPEQPGGDGLTPVPSRRENAWQNAGYVLQWWLFAAMTLAGFGWLARREATGPHPAGNRAHGADRVPDDRVPDDRVPDDPAPGPTGRPVRAG
jgi:cytochrome oxidase assembly protein ShyY1